MHKIKRRNFIKKSSVLASSSLIVPSFLMSSCRSSKKGSIIKNIKNERNLIVIQLAGGNDGLNTFIPFENNLYYNLRPKISIKEKDVLKFGGMLGFHPALKNMEAVYKDGGMAIIQNVGYPNPDRSHFRSSDIWQSGGSSDQVFSTGWMGRYLDHNCRGADPHYALDFSPSLQLGLTGNESNGMALSNSINELHSLKTNPYLKELYRDHAINDSQLVYAKKSFVRAQESIDYLLNKSKNPKTIKGAAPKSIIAKQLAQISQLINQGAESKIFFANHSGFDTHSFQPVVHTKLLTEFAEGISVLYNQLKDSSQWENTLVLVFSEFGRRVKENGYQGTDHGAGNNTMLFGGSLKQTGFVNDLADLKKLENGDLKYNVDFRSIYKTIVEKWLQAPFIDAHLREFKSLDFI